MDPISAAGIGLGATSLTLQVFAGCIKGYQIFSDAADVPSQYQHLLTRLRLEQVRLLNWGEEVGLLEASLERTSTRLGFDHNVINDVLLGIQTAFRGCADIKAKYDSFIEKQTTSPIHGRRDKHRGLTTKLWLERVLSAWDEPSRVTARLKWAMIKRESFEKLVAELIAYNDRMESFLDRNALEEVHAMQTQSNLILLQVTDEVAQLRLLVEAMSITRQPINPGLHTSLSPVAPVFSESAAESTIASLAQFKVEAILLDSETSEKAPPRIDFADVVPEDPDLESTHAIGRYRHHNVWIEWREQVEDDRSSPVVQQVIEKRVKQLTALLRSENKSPLFRAPLCLGYIRDERDDVPRYALVYEAVLRPQSTGIKLQTLRDALTGLRAPSLGKRIVLACTLTESLYYLHAVSWLHKGMRSDSIVFVRQVSDSNNSIDNSKLVAMIDSPILSGFDFSRPDLIDEQTFRNATTVERGLYCHPDLLQFKTGRFHKSYDIYGLGLVLLEIAFWQPIE